MEKYQTFRQRFVAALIDAAIFFPLSLGVSFFYQASDPKTTLFILVLDQFLFLFYSISMHGKYGQTIGKWVMKVKVLNIDETKLTIKQAVLRDGVPIGLACIYILFSMGPISAGLNPDSQTFKQAIPAAISSLGITVLVLEMLSMFTNPKRRSIYDFIAGSVVVKQPNTSFKRDA